MKLFRFADEHDLVLELIRFPNQERTFGFSAHFADIGIKPVDPLAFGGGRGSSPTSAMRDFVKKIRGKTLVKMEGSDYLDRGEIVVPKNLVL